MRFLLAALVLAAACDDDTKPDGAPAAVVGPPAAKVKGPDAAAGERIFSEPRFAELYHRLCKGDVNAAVASSEPALDVAPSVFEDSPGPFAGSTMSCRACHFVNELQKRTGEGPRRYADWFVAGVRNYSDFARRTPIPDRGDGRTTTARNSPTLVNAVAHTGRASPHLHFDGEFATAEDLVRGTFTGRNFGWLADEHEAAIAHIASVVRGDDGVRAREHGGLPYATLLRGGEDVPARLRISPGLRIEVKQASDSAILDALARIVRAYMETLRFATDDSGAHSGSPYDVFLRKNALPRQPRDGESSIGYARRLKARLRQLATPAWVTSADGSFQLQAQAFVFGPKQLRGLELFLAERDDRAARGRHGACLLCHAPPEFTDFGFHNMGVAQEEYDAIHGAGAFARLKVPTLGERNADPERFLPPSPKHPRARGPFLAIPSREHPGETDLGLWNVLGNEAIPAPQEQLRLIFGSEDQADDDQLRRSIALFKTPTLRDLGQSGPYFHTGRKDSIDAVLAFYIEFSALARARKVRNPAPELGQIQIAEQDVEPLRAFLRSLNEDFQ